MAYKHAKKDSGILKKWMNCGQPKVVVKVDNEEQLLQIMKTAKQNGLISVVVCDAGRTQVESGTRTVVGVGPGPVDIIDKVTGHLKLY